MEAVLKVGGSLTKEADSLTKLCKKLAFLAKDHKIVVVPGGGEFADTVRKIDKIYSLSDSTVHKMAILAMDQYGLFLSDITPESYVSYSLKETNNFVNDRLPIFLPSRLIFYENPLENSWNVTSDTIAAYIASKLNAQKVILVTNVDGIFFEDPKKILNTRLIEELSAKEIHAWNKRTSVDKTLPKMILETRLDCYVVNGNYPERIKLILENKRTICTHITA